MKIALILGKWSTGLHGKLSPRDLYTRGRPLTGSESSFFNMAKALSESGHDVTVYCDCQEETHDSEILSGAHVLSVEREVEKADAYVSLNEPDQLRLVPSGGLRVCWQQLGDFPGNQSNNFDDFVDQYVALSPRHMEYIVGSSKTPSGKWSWIPNSINMEMFEGGESFRDIVRGGVVPRRPFSMAWCSSPDRGLHRLLEMFPEIRERVPGATLDIYYRFDPWYERAKSLSDPTGDRARYIHECLSRLGREGENGVKVVGPVANREMARRLRETTVFPYTCDCLRFTETFCVSLLDACASGCAVLTSDEDAIGQIFGDAALVIKGKPRDNRSVWVDSIVRCLTNTSQAVEMGRNARQFAEHFDRSYVVAVWEKMLSGLLDEMTSISEYVKTYGKKVEEVAVSKREEKPVIEIGERKLRIAVILGKTGSPVHGIMDVNKVFDVDGSFATGTVTGFFNIAWGLAERGHTIDAFCECKENVVGSKLGGANFYNIDREQVSPTYDVYLSVNEAEMLRGKPKEALKITALWLNDFSYCQPGWDDHVDVYACPSETHRLYIRGRGEVPVEKLDVIPLCVSWELHDEALPRRFGSIAYCSSPDRGLHHILAMFPEITARVPGANLSVYYRLKPWLSNIINDPVLAGSHMRWRADTIKTVIEELGEDGSRGLTLKGPVSPRMMARELRQTVVMAYPCDPVRFTEGFSAAILDACAAGCVPIVAAVDALPEVYGGAVHLISGNPGENKKKWVDAVCLALTDEGFASEVRADARIRARELSRVKVAAQWEKLIRERMARK